MLVLVDSPKLGLDASPYAPILSLTEIKLVKLLNDVWGFYWSYDCPAASGANLVDVFLGDVARFRYFLLSKFLRVTSWALLSL